MDIHSGDLDKLVAEISSPPTRVAGRSAIAVAAKRALVRPERHLLVMVVVVREGLATRLVVKGPLTPSRFASATSDDRCAADPSREARVVEHGE